MSSIKTAISLLKTPGKMIMPLADRGLFNWLPDKPYLKLVYRGEMGKRLDLEHPQTFNEKLQWLKIHDHNPVYTQLVDKIKAKEIVGSIIGNEHIVPMYGSWDKAEDIPFGSLPEKYVLKCNHDQGSVVLVDSNHEVDKESLRRYYKKRLKRKNYYLTREYGYKNIIPKVFAEKYLGEQIKDYKFYCFNGEPKFLYVGQGLTCDHSLKIDYFDLDWNIMPFYRTDYDRLGSVTKPQQLEQMIEIATKLSEGFPFVRIDLFEIDDVVYFSEFSPCPASGYMPFVPNEYDRIVGSWLKLQEYDKKNKNYVDFV